MLDSGRFPVRLLLRAGVFAAAYFGCAFVSRTLTTTLNFEASFWLPSGLLLAALLVRERREWFWLIAGAFIGGFLFNLQGARWPFHLWFLTYVANVLTAVVGAELVFRFGSPRPALRTVRELIALFVFGALLSNVLSATAGWVSLKVLGARGNGWDLWRAWFLSNALGVMLLTPMLLAWRGANPWSRLRRHPRRIEAILLVAVMCLLMMLCFVFRGVMRQPSIAHFLPIPFMIWAAIRFETRGVTLTSMVVAVLAGWFTVWDYTVEGGGLVQPWHNTQLQLNLAAFSFFGLFPAIAIAAHRRTTEALQASEARYTRALRGAGDGLWEWNIVTGSSYYSSRWKEMLGFSEAELASERDDSFVSRIHPEDLPRVQRALRAHLDQNVPYNLEFRLRTKDESYRWFRSRGEAERDSRGQPIRVAGTIQDVTDRVLAEESLQESRRALVTLMGNLPGMAYRRRYDADMTLEFASEGARDLTGYAPVELVAPARVKYLELIHPEDQSLVRATVDAGVREARPYRLSYRIIAAGGVEKWVWEQGLAVTTAGDGVTVLEGFVTDITERKRLEQQVIRAQRRESIGTLTAGVAHNLNNMLVPIVMGAELLRLPASEEENERVLDNIENSARRAADLVKQLLAFGRGLEGVRARVAIPQVVREVEAIVASTFPKNILFRTELRDPWPVIGDGTQLHQVLLNLCLNARDAMPDGGSLALTARNEELAAGASELTRGLAPGRYVRLDVEDTGCGMSREVCERIFEPFFTTKEVNKGTGLGLSTVLGIVRSHGGTIHVSSQPAQGSRFTVLLPAMPEETTSSPELPGPQAPAGRGELVLVIDDEAGVLTVTQRSLEAAGYKVIAAESGESAIELYARYRNSIAVVITDVLMPGMGGAAVVTALRRFNPTVKIIATSGLPPAELGRNLNVDHLLQKPYEPMALVSALKRVLQTASLN